MPVNQIGAGRHNQTRPPPLQKDKVWDEARDGVQQTKSFTLPSLVGVRLRLNTTGD